MTVVTEFDLLKYRRTKIVATLGPASAQPDIIHALVGAGVDVFRLNMSHGDHAFHAALVERIRAAANDSGRHVGILADLCGPKIRTGRFHDGRADLIAGTAVTVTTRDVTGTGALIPSQYQALAGDVTPGNRILLADGALELRVLAVAGTEIHCEVVHGGTIGDHKGINLPGVAVSAPSLTDKDRDDARFALAQGVDFLALSFVRRAGDIEALREITGGAGTGTHIIAKIEKPEALAHSAEIIAAADGIMVARGDLGVELNPEQVPAAQHQLIEQARAANKPVIVATQMLESMVENPRPTRAEVTDVSHAVALGADAVMLSAETAAGAYPLRAVEIMARIAKQTEAFFRYQRPHVPRATVQPAGMPVPFGDAVADATAQLTADLSARAVMVISRNGMTTATIVAARPAAPVVAISGTAGVCRRMNLLWGAIPVLDAGVGRRNPNGIARDTAKELGLAEPGQFVLLVRGFNSDPAYNTPSITVLKV
ncbi:MAG: pyruvate kinase [Gammaproteobacteria bacterium]|nr:pyruvate kinase [Gammaproteobacteria bacterium]